MKKKQITLIAVGDIVLVKRFEKTVRKSKTEGILASVNNCFKGGDVIFGNLECPISNSGDPIFKVAPKFRASPESVYLLKDLGFTILNLANNHINDFGGLAIIETMHALTKAHIDFVGAGNNIDEAISPKVIHIQGFRIGFLGFCDKEESIAKRSAPGAAEVKEDVVNRKIEKLRDEVDYVVLSLHMGIEFVDFPSPHNVAMCRRFIDRGVNVILGHHPHVPQGYEIYNGGLIIYSLGNFVFDMGRDTPEKSKIGFIYKILLTNGNIEKVTPVPYKMNNNYIPHLVHNENERKALLMYIERLSTPLKNQQQMEAIWYSTSRFFTRQLIKALLYRTFKQKKWWFLMWWLKIATRPQVRKVWLSYIWFLARGTHKKTSKNLAFSDFTLGR